jgi:REP element-mobilizing transposase RayT
MDYRSRGWYFVTICTRSRASLFGELLEGSMRLSPIGIIAASELQRVPSHYDNVTIDECVVMPNHVHAVVMIDGDHYFSPSACLRMPGVNTKSASDPLKAGSLSAIIGSYKAGVTRRCHELGIERAIWQPRFYDHLLRGDRVIAAVREYIRNNPANWHQDNENPYRR